MGNHELFAPLVDHILSREGAHPLRVAIDGIDAAGKTTLADTLVQPLEARGKPVIRASIDGFHRPRAERYRQGTDSPVGYYDDSFDYTALRDALLRPLGPGVRQRLLRRTAILHNVVVRHSISGSVVLAA